MFKNILKIFSSHIIVKALGLLNVVIIINALSLNNFGEYSYYLVILSLITIIINPIFSSYLIEFRINEYKKFNFGLLIVPFVLITPFYFGINYLKSQVNFSIFILFSFTYILYAVLKYYLNVKEKYIEYGIVDITLQLIILVSSIIVIYVYQSNDFIFLLFFTYSATSISSIILYFVLIKRKDFEFSVDYNRIKTLVLKSKYFIFYSVIIPFIAFIDSYFIDNYLTESELGYYSFSLKLFNISMMLIVPITTVLNIEQIKIAKQDNYWVFVKNNLKKVISLASVLFIVAVFSNIILLWFVFPEYKPSFWTTNILLATSFIIYLCLPFSFLMAYKKYKQLFKLALIATVIDIIINFLFIKQFGVVASAFATFFAYSIIGFGGAIMSFVLLKRKNRFLNKIQY